MKGALLLELLDLGGQEEVNIRPRYMTGQPALGGQPPFLDSELRVRESAAQFKGFPSSSAIGRTV